ncbi:MAG: hydroxyethylthiazole kinase [Brachymonas sp.]|jgi:hydroxyethylthiazole kinase|nr:hydroxyethylthiazole kinase [Brachymonas sp.]
MKSNSQLSAQDVWADIATVRQNKPLVHCITNLVVTNFTANVLLACGAAPVMAHAHEEVQDMAGIAQGLLLNIGTLDPYWVQSMKLAFAAAQKRGIPVVIDPVGAGATSYRNQALEELLQQGMPAVVRGNASEVMSMAHVAITSRGVESSANVNDALGAAQALAARTQGTVCVSGEVDHILHVDGRHASLHNGHEWLTRITGVGCALTALIAAVCSVQPDHWRATITGMAWMGIAGEIAFDKTQHAGIGSMAVALLDALQQLREEDVAARLRIVVDGL